MVFTGLAVFFVNITDFRHQQEMDFRAATGGHLRAARPGKGVAQPQKAVPSGYQFFFYFSKPPGMGGIARAHHGNPFALRGNMEMLQIERLGGRPRKSGVDMEIS